jgi:hypothetical protein
VNEAAVDTSAPRLAGVVAVLDRYFPLLWIGLYALLPVSGWATVMFDSWFDQQRDLEALRSVLESGSAEAITDSVIGPAYIAAAALVHELFGLSAEDSLVALTRASYALSVAGGVLLVGVLVRRLTSAPPIVSLAAQFTFVALAFAVGTWHWSDVPWSHFFAAFLAVAVYVIRFAPARFGAPHAAAAGAVLALLAATRTFEFGAVVLAWGLAVVVLAALRVDRWTPRGAHIAWGSAAFVGATVLAYAATGKRNLFVLYSSHLDHQSGNVGSGELAETPTFSLSLVPTKLVQLFVEPCYYALCSISDYEGRVAGLSPQLVGDAGNYRLWRLPLAVQLPSLLLLPLCMLVVAALVVWAVRNRPAARERLQSLRLLVELTLASTGILLGYAASTLTGSPHLRYGLVRDFLLPALLIGIVSVALVSAGVWILLSRMGRRGVSPAFAFVMLSVVGSACLVGVLAYARSDGIPRIESRQLGAVVYSARCSDGRCDVQIEATNRRGAPLSIPEASTLTFGCGSDVARFSIYEDTPTDGVLVTEPCSDPRLVAAWPTVMGLPPGSFELGAVRIRNV